MWSPRPGCRVEGRSGALDAFPHVIGAHLPGLGGIRPVAPRVWSGPLGQGAVLSSHLTSYFLSLRFFICK